MSKWRLIRLINFWCDSKCDLNKQKSMLVLILYQNYCGKKNRNAFSMHFDDKKWNTIIEFILNKEKIFKFFIIFEKSKFKKHDTKHILTQFMRSTKMNERITIINWFELKVAFIFKLLIWIIVDFYWLTIMHRMYRWILLNFCW